MNYIVLELYLLGSIEATHFETKKEAADYIKETMKETGMGKEKFMLTKRENF